MAAGSPEPQEIGRHPGPPDTRPGRIGSPRARGPGPPSPLRIMAAYPQTTPRDASAR